MLSGMNRHDMNENENEVKRLWEKCYAVEVTEHLPFGRWNGASQHSFAESLLTANRAG